MDLTKFYRNEETGYRKNLRMIQRIKASFRQPNIGIHESVEKVDGMNKYFRRNSVHPNQINYSICSSFNDAMIFYPRFEKWSIAFDLNFMHQ